jgi:hypothetical protein
LLPPLEWVPVANGPPKEVELVMLEVIVDTLLPTSTP